MQRSYFPTYDVFFDGVLDPGHVDRGHNQGLAVTLRMNISCICCDHIEKHVQARLIYRKSSQVMPGQQNTKKHGTRQKNIQTSIILLMEEMKLALAPVEVGLVYPIIYGVFHISTAEGFLPSPVFI